MEYQTKKKIELHRILKTKGWHQEDDRLYPPHGSFSMEGDSEMPLHMIEKMYKKSKEILDDTKRKGRLFADLEQSQNWLEDMQSIVDILRELLEENRN